MLKNTFKNLFENYFKNYRSTINNRSNEKILPNSKMFENNGTFELIKKKNWRLLNAENKTYARVTCFRFAREDKTSSAILAVKMGRERLNWDHLFYSSSKGDQRASLVCFFGSSEYLLKKKGFSSKTLL
uniref:(California timema) hypothetical protein n=1 Tax=Timema californicum TaxID=61474 RepID=A0A7R9J7S3_TIMCA|nr:unnamed protein product [Timema californicum]